MTRRHLPSVVQRLSAPLLVLPLVVVFFGKLALTNLILARGDTFLYFYPYWAYRAQSLLAGHLPLWNPFLFMGAPFLANSQAGVLYPLNWPLVVFSAPVAVKISVIVHLVIAASGAFIFARRSLQQSAMAALLAAILFGLGGYLTAQVEHINQLQALAWFPWLLLNLQSPVFGRPSTGDGRQPVGVRVGAWRLMPAAMILALQLLAGHTQSVFISLAGASLYILILAYARTRPGAIEQPQPFSRILISIAVVTLLAVLLAAAQLLPTFELSRESLRGGGLSLREALSFSMSPRLIGRALLPGYSRALFSEFTAYVGVVGLGLLPFGLGRTPHRFALIVLACVGLTFALGAYNPLYALLAAFPPFNLFRVPARWLFLFAFAAAMLAGYGLDALNRPRRRSLFLLGIGSLLLFTLTPLANKVTTPGETGPLGSPQWQDVAGWALPLIILAALTWFRLPDRLRALGIVLTAALELFFAAQVLPFNHLTAPEAYASVRPGMTQLLATLSDSLPPARFLSMSALRFDPGDLKELRSELDSQLPPEAVYDAIVAAKHKEVLSPNLSLAWGVPAVDGFDGGILPLRHYADFSALFTGAVSADGRLRENMTAAPDPRLLSLVNARYLVTDKVDDAWVDEVFYDLQFPVSLQAGAAYRVTSVPRFLATGLALVTDSATGGVQLTFADGSRADIALSAASRRAASSVLPFGRPARPTSITFIGPLTVRGASLVDERSAAFQMLTLGPYRLVHSGDVKIYENPYVLPRAFVVTRATVVVDEDAARAALLSPDFNPASVALLAVAPDNPPPTVQRTPAAVPVVSAEPERMVMLADGPGYLVVTEAYYPGWIALVDGQPAPILRADIMFRAVALPEGTHTVELRFAPRSVSLGFWISGLAWFGVFFLWWLTQKRRPAGSPPVASSSPAP